MVDFSNADPYNPYGGLLSNPVYGQGILNMPQATAPQPGFSPVPQPQQPQPGRFGGFLQNNSNSLMSLGSALLSQPTFGMALANFGQQAPQSMARDQRRKAMNGILKNYKAMSPDQRAYFQANPEAFDAFYTAQMTPKAPITLAKGGSLYDPNSGQFIQPPGMAAREDAPAGYTWNPDGTLAAIPGGPDDPNNPNSKAANTSVDNEKALRGEYLKGSQDFMSVRDSYSRIQAAAQEHTGASDLAMVYSYMKMLDPGSAVREGEFANAENAGGVPSQIISLYNKVIGGGRLPEFMRQQFVQQATRQYQAAMERQKNYTGTYTGLSKSYGFDPSHITPDLSAGVQPQAVPPPPQQGAVVDGYMFKGGDPADPSNWQQMGQGTAY